MDLTPVGLVGGQWDLRDTVDAYLGHHAFAGKRVLDVGAASGFLSFEMERRGAEVVSFDMAPDGRWDIVPLAGLNLEAAIQGKRDNWRALTNAYWFAHAALGSRAKVFYGDVYELPAELGVFDVVFVGSILLHLRDPFAALQSVSRRAGDTVIVTDLAFELPGPQMQLVPTRVGPADTWWRLSPLCVAQMLDVLGFDALDLQRSRHTSTYEDNRRDFDFYTLVSKKRG
jgi:SAM-dependent methyltransferase